jgi:hypothetical protein
VNTTLSQENEYQAVEESRRALDVLLFRRHLIVVGGLDD